MQVITREDLIRRLGSEDLRLVEVLSPEQYRKYHLPGAVNVPFDDRFDENIREAAPDREQPVVVYCADERCDASTQAARQLEDLGYRRVYDYAAGKADWREAGLPTE